MRRFRWCSRCARRSPDRKNTATLLKVKKNKPVLPIIKVRANILPAGERGYAGRTVPKSFEMLRNILSVALCMIKDMPALVMLRIMLSGMILKAG